MLIDMNRNTVAIDRNAAATHKGMAHFAGTGPAGKRCGKCAFWAPIENARTNVCRKARQLGAISKTAIPAGTRACKYFEVA